MQAAPVLHGLRMVQDQEDICSNNQSAHDRHRAANDLVPDHQRLEADVADTDTSRRGGIPLCSRVSLFTKPSGALHESHDVD